MHPHGHRLSLDLVRSQTAMLSLKICMGNAAMLCRHNAP